MKIMLAEILRQADLTIAPGPPIQTIRRGLTLVPHGGTPVIVKGIRG